MDLSYLLVGTYKVDVQLITRPPTILAVDVQKINLSLVEMKNTFSNVLELDTLSMYAERKSTMGTIQNFSQVKIWIGPRVQWKNN